MSDKNHSTRHTGYKETGELYWTCRTCNQRVENFTGHRCPEREYCEEHSEYADFCRDKHNRRDSEIISCDLCNNFFTTVYSHYKEHRNNCQLEIAAMYRNADHRDNQYKQFMDSQTKDDEDLTKHADEYEKLITENSAYKKYREAVKLSNRKESPVFSGVLQYFPDAIMEIAKHSKKGNDKHNPGQPLHWSKDKSPDHADCVARHLIDVGPIWDALDEETGSYHATALAWRALALLQIMLERKKQKNE